MSKLKNNPMQANIKELCGAKTKNGRPCSNAQMQNGRCRMHGGLSTGAPIGNKNALKNGMFTKEAKKQRQEISAFLKECRTLLKDNT